MSKLGLHMRPIVLFDPSNKLHRQWVTGFMESGSWRECPVRFAIEEDHGNLLGMIQRKLILWYANQEKKGKLEAPKLKRGKNHIGHTGGGFELTT